MTKFGTFRFFKTPEYNFLNHECHYFVRLGLTTDTLPPVTWSFTSRPATSSVLSIPSHRLTIVLLAFLVICSPQFYPARLCLPGFPSLSSHDKPSGLPLLNDLQQRVILPNVAATLVCEHRFTHRMQLYAGLPLLSRVTPTSESLMMPVTHV